MLLSTPEPNPHHSAPIGYGQWVNISIYNRGSRDIKIQNLVVPWGKLYKGPGTSTSIPNSRHTTISYSIIFSHLGNMDVEISPTKYEGRVIKPNETVTIHACCRKASPSGTSGEFSLIDTKGGQVIRHLYWDCPWGNARNAWILSGSNSQWTVDSEGGNLDEGPLGVITVNVFNIN